MVRTAAPVRSIAVSTTTAVTPIARARRRDPGPPRSARPAPRTARGHGDRRRPRRPARSEARRCRDQRGHPGHEHQPGQQPQRGLGARRAPRGRGRGRGPGSASGRTRGDRCGGLLGGAPRRWARLPAGRSAPRRPGSALDGWPRRHLDGGLSAMRRPFAGPREGEDTARRVQRRARDPCREEAAGRLAGMALDLGAAALRRGRPRGRHGGTHGRHRQGGARAAWADPAGPGRRCVPRRRRGGGGRSEAGADRRAR